MKKDPKNGPQADNRPNTFYLGPDQVVSASSEPRASENLSSATRKPIRMDGPIAVKQAARSWSPDLGRAAELEISNSGLGHRGNRQPVQSSAFGAWSLGEATEKNSSVTVPSKSTAAFTNSAPFTNAGPTAASAQKPAGHRSGGFHSGVSPTTDTPRSAQPSSGTPATRGGWESGVTRKILPGNVQQPDYSLDAPKDSGFKTPAAPASPPAAAIAQPPAAAIKATAVPTSQGKPSQLTGSHFTGPQRTVPQASPAQVTRSAVAVPQTLRSPQSAERMTARDIGRSDLGRSAIGRSEIGRSEIGRTEMNREAAWAPRQTPATTQSGVQSTPQTAAFKAATPAVSQAAEATVPTPEANPNAGLIPVQPQQISSERRCLFDLTQMIANITEAYTVALFLADNQSRTLTPAAYHTLSREFNPNAHIAFGNGLVGWTAQNVARVSVCPFEHDASTLLYYTTDQSLKSFIAVPVVASSETASKTEPPRLLGVIACDSKRSYAFAKITEKILLDCAKQAAYILQLQAQLETVKPRPDIREPQTLGAVLDKLRSMQTEQDLLSFAAALPQEVVERDALVSVTTAEGGVGAGRFYPASVPNEIQHRLIQTVCSRKKVINGNRSVHALPVDDLKQRSFLSIPFRVLGTEAGSLNLLSRPREAFDSTTIRALEKIADVVGSQLEAIRLRERAMTNTDADSMLTWKQFVVKAQSRFAEARKSTNQLAALRLSFQGLGAVERLAGIDVAAEISARLARLLAQTVRSPAMSCVLYGTEFFVLCESAEAESLLARFDRLLARVCNEDFKDKPEIGSVLRHSLLVSSALFPNDGSSVVELANRCRERLNQSEQPPIGEVANARFK